MFVPMLALGCLEPLDFEVQSIECLFVEEVLVTREKRDFGCV